MNTQDLDARLKNLADKITSVKEHKDFEAHYNDGHKRTLAEIERHQKELHEKIEKDMHDYEEAHGHLNALEKQMIILTDSL